LDKFVTLVGTSARKVYGVRVGAKADLTDRRAVSAEEPQRFVERSGLRYFEASALTGAGVTQAITGLVLNVGMQGEFRLLWRGSRDGFRA
jgi:hypothetical protein